MRCRCLNPFGTGLLGPSAARIRRPSGPRGGEPLAPASGPQASVYVADRRKRRSMWPAPLALASGPQASVYVAGGASRRLTGHLSRRPSVPLRRLTSSGLRQSSALHALRSVPGRTREPSATMAGAVICTRRYCVVDIERPLEVSTCPGPFACCHLHRVVAKNPRHVMPISESPCPALASPSYERDGGLSAASSSNRLQSMPTPSTRGLR